MRRSEMLLGFSYTRRTFMMTSIFVTITSNPDCESLNEYRGVWNVNRKWEHSMVRDQTAAGDVLIWRYQIVERYIRPYK